MKRNPLLHVLLSLSFIFAAGAIAAPALLTLPPNPVTSDSATLRGSFDTKKHAANACFQIRLPKKGWQRHTPWQTIRRGQREVEFSEFIGGLTPEQPYEARTIVYSLGVVHYGRAVAFQTQPRLPIVIPDSLTVSDVTGASAILGGAVNANAHAPATAWFQWGPTASEFTTEPTTVSGTQTITAAVSSLLPKTSYRFLLCASNISGIVKSELHEFETLPAPPLIAMDAVTDLSASSATLHAIVTPNGADTEVVFQWGIHSFEESARIDIVPASNDPVPVSLVVTSLLGGAAYQFRVAATNSAGGAVSLPATFETLCISNPPVLVENTVQARAIETRSAALSAQVQTPLCLPATVWFRVRPNSGPEFVTTATTVSGNVVVESTRIDLAPGTVYNFSVVASNAAGASVSSNYSFQTLVGIPIVTMVAASPITQHSAGIRAMVDPNGAPTEILFQWGLNGVFDHSKSAGIIPPGSPILVSAYPTELIEGTLYVYRAVATNSVGTGFGSTAVFRTACATNIVSLTNATEADLRAAIATSATITFAADTSITLASPIEVGCAVTLDAAGHSVVLDGGNNGRVFNVETGATLNLFGITLIHGAARGTDGPAMDSFPGPLDGQSIGGGAISVSRAALVSANCRFLTNTVVGGNGGRTTNDSAAAGQLSRSGGSASGGAIYASDSYVYLTNCVFEGNLVSGGAAGEYYDAADRGRVPGSNGPGTGGAILLVHCRNSAIVGCAFVHNTAISGTTPRNPARWWQDVERPFGTGGAVTISDSFTFVLDSAFEGNQAAGDGGAIKLEAAEVTIDGCRFLDNAAAGPASTVGGAVGLITGRLFVHRSSFAFNRVKGGDSLYNPGGNGFNGYPGFGGGLAIMSGGVEVNSCFFGTNTAVGGASSPFFGIMAQQAFFRSGDAMGGGLYNADWLTIVNSTFAGNHAASGEALETVAASSDSGVGVGGGIAHVSGYMHFNFNTVVGNDAGCGPGHANMGIGGGLSFTNWGATFGGNIFAWNTASETNANNVVGLGNNDGYNITSHAEAPFWGTGDRNGADPLLGPLGNYGGPTLIFPLLDGSPAIDAVNIIAPATDQRGVARPQGARPDIGAFEK